MNKNLLLIIGVILLGIGLIKPSFMGNTVNKPAVTNQEFVAPTSESLKAKADSVIEALSVHSDRKTDGKKLASLYYDIATLISLEGNDEVIKNTEEIRQANKLSGLMLHLNIKDKYPNLAESNQSLIVEAIGDDNVPLTKELRKQAVDAFMSLAWACNEGSK